MSKVSIKPPVMGDILKSEADVNSRIAIAVTTAVAIGALVEHPERDGKFLVALSNSENGKVLVQPRNCTICLSSIKTSEITANTTLDELKSQGDVYGIKYVGEPIDDGTSPPDDGTTTPDDG